MTIVVPCDLQPHGDGKFKLSTRLVVRMEDGTEIVVPAGFITDFASSLIGRWDFLSRRASRSVASILHDWLYFTGLFTRKKADQYFIEGLKSEGCGWYDRSKATAGLRSFGWVVWNRYRRHDS